MLAGFTVIVADGGVVDGLCSRLAGARGEREAGFHQRPAATLAG